MEKDFRRGVVYLTVSCDHPYLVSLLFAVLLPLHVVTFFIINFVKISTHKFYERTAQCIVAAI